jgi:hypothetical protein
MPQNSVPRAVLPGLSSVPKETTQHSSFASLSDILAQRLGFGQHEIRLLAYDFPLFSIAARELIVRHRNQADSLLQTPHPNTLFASHSFQACHNLNTRNTLQVCSHICKIVTNRCRNIISFFKVLAQLPMTHTMTYFAVLAQLPTMTHTIPPHFCQFKQNRTDNRV